MVCGAKRASVIIDTQTTTLRTFMDKVIIGHLGFSNPSFDNKESLYLEADDIQDSMWKTQIASLPGGGIQDGTIVSVLDLDQDLGKSRLLLPVLLSFLSRTTVTLTSTVVLHK